MSGPEVVVIGGAMVDYHYAVTNLPEPDGGSFAPNREVAFGGVGANVSIALDRLGRDVALLSRVGDDETGNLVRDHLADTGVRTDRVRTGDDETTHSIILRDPGGERMIVTAGESYRRLRLTDDDLASLADADCVFVTAYTPDRVVSRLLDAAGDPGFPPIAFDLSGPIDELRGRATEPETIDLALERAALFVTGTVAAASFFGDRASAIDRLASAPVPRAAYTRGEDGATLFEGAERTEVDAFEVDAVDTTGAGDAFVAGLLDRWLLGSEEPASAGRFAAAAAAINCTEAYTQPGLATRDEVLEFLADRSG